MGIQDLDDLCFVAWPVPDLFEHLSIYSPSLDQIRVGLCRVHQNIDMLARDEFDALLAQHGTLVIDGALATELEARGHDLSHPLWSGKVLRQEANSIEQVHLDYYLAGADIAITASYQIATRGLALHFAMSEHEGQNLIKQSVRLAQNARTAAYEGGIDPRRRLLVAGSVGPFGAFLADGSEYRGDYGRSREDLQDFHRPRIQALIDAGVDLLALETIPSSSEIEALLALLDAEFPTAIAWLGCTLKDSSHLSDGTLWENVAGLIDEYPKQIVAVGVNCVPLHSVSEMLKHISQVTKLPLLCYPNSGEVWDSATKTWHAAEACDETCDTHDELSQHGRSPAQIFPLWLANGARLVGGCCRTRPAFVRSLRKSLESNNE